MRRLIKIAVLLVGLLPASTGKNRLLNLFGHRVHPTATVAPILLINVEKFAVGAGTRIGLGTGFRNLRSATIGAHSAIGKFNTISAAPIYRNARSPHPELRGVFSAGDGTLVTRQHILDCSGGVVLEDFASLTGHGVLIYSHAVDLRRYRMACAPTRVKEGGIVTARVVLTMGSTVPERSVVTMGSVLMPGARKIENLYVGVPAKPVGKIGGWKAFDYGTHEGAARTKQAPFPTIERHAVTDG